MKALLKHAALFVVYSTLCILATLLVVFFNYLQNRPELKPWHMAKLDAEFHAADAATVRLSMTIAVWRTGSSRNFGARLRCGGRCRSPGAQPILHRQHE